MNKRQLEKLIDKHNHGFAIYVSPEEEWKLLANSQFISAGEYGSKRIIAQGEIGSLNGKRIIERRFASEIVKKLLDLKDNWKLLNLSEKRKMDSKLCLELL